MTYTFTPSPPKKEKEKERKDPFMFVIRTWGRGALATIEGMDKMGINAKRCNLPLETTTTYLVVWIESRVGTLPSIN